LTATTYTVTGLINETAYTFGVTATDTSGNESSPSTVTATPQAPGGAELLTTATNQGRTWTATVTSPDGSDLTGSFNYGDGGTCTGSTCALSGIPKKVGSVTFTSSAGGTVVISKP
ncbi:MAG TPA: hypothetical protein VJ398_01285, partial [Acidimicrobiia bacterium]|nr:hypothetical protein [Acidimicrobiia bacterium]